MNLAKTQFLSIATKGVTTALGIVQSVLIVRLLTPAEFGITGLVMSIGSVIGVSQHLGIVDGAIREIAVRKNKRQVALVSWVAHIVRQAVTLPLSLGLFFFASAIAGSYGKPEIAVYIQIFAAALIFQGLQDVLGATLTGLKKFSQLYAIQIITAAINIAVFGLLVWRYNVAGFFWAIVLTTAIMVVLMAAYTARVLQGALALPSMQDLRLYGKSVLRIGAYMYIARIFFVLWQRSPLLILGGILAADELGYLNVSMTFGSRLTILAMALSEVNLSWMSSLFIEKPNEFRERVARNMRRVFLFMLAITSGLLFFTPEILRYIIGSEYLSAEPIIYIMTVAFFLYSLLDIGTSSLFVPADNPRQRTIVYGLLMLVTGGVLGWLYMSRPDVLLASVAMLAGAAISYVVMISFATSYKVAMVSGAELLLLTLLGVSVGWLLTGPTLVLRSIVFLLLTFTILIIARRQRLLPAMSDLLTRKTNTKSKSSYPIVCFAGGFYDAPFWTNRQHIMSRVSHSHRVLYIEPRVWIVRHLWRNAKSPRSIWNFLQKVFFWKHETEHLVTIAQWNLLPGSREYKAISTINHYLNRWCVLAKASWLGFHNPIVWIYDTEAAEYLDAFPDSFVLYDCVDDHAAQAGVDRNPKRVEEEEAAILERANLVTVTSVRLYELKKSHNKNTHLVLNAGDVELFSLQKSRPEVPPILAPIQQHGPILGSVGALDAYKVDFDLLLAVAEKMPAWQFVFIGKPVVDTRIPALKKLRALSNVHVLSDIPRTEVPTYVHQFDVCLIPYKHSRYNEASFPLKFWEFMATGKPIIVSGLPELKPYEPMSHYVKNAEEFIEIATQELANENGDAEKRMRLASNHSWDKRAQRIMELIST